MTLNQIVPNVYAISLTFVNAFLIDTEDGLILIDTGIAGSGDKILQAVSELGKKPADIRHILLTHCHGDHTGSLAMLKKETGAPATMHPLDAAMVRKGESMRPAKPAPGLLFKIIVPLTMRQDTHIEPVDIEHEIQDDEVLDLAGGIQVIHVPGHCAGQVAFLCPQLGGAEHSGVLFTGDVASNMFKLGWPIIFEDFEAGKRSLAKIAKLKFDVACFGHGKAIEGKASEKFRKKWLIA